MILFYLPSSNYYKKWRIQHGYLELYLHATSKK